MRIETIGTATLYLGDCRDILPTLPRVDAVVTDPPWNMNYFKDDDKSWPEYAEWLQDIKSICEDHADGQVWILGTKSIPYISHLFNGYKPFACVKNFSQMTKKSLPNCWDIAFIKSEGYKGNGRNWFLCNTAGMLSQRTGHPTPRTLDVMEFIIGMYGWQVILDPFMGSATTGVAAINHGRQFIGIEQEEKYFDICCKRIEAAVAESEQRLFV